MERKLVLGAWSWGKGAAGGDQVFGNNYGVKELKPVFEEGLKYGLNTIDTAAVYGMGASEEILGSFIKEIDRKNIVISTKFTPQIADGTKEEMLNMFNGSLERLNTDYIDLYWIHNPMNVERYTKELIPLFKTGKIKRIGLSNHNLKEIKLASEILKTEGIKVSAIQNHYSLLHRSSEKAGILDYCKKNGIEFYSYMVLEQGALSGRYSSSHPFAENSERGKVYNPILDKLDNLIAVLSNIGKNHDLNVSQTAISWAIGKGTIPIIGVTKTYQVKEAYEALNVELNQEEMLKLENEASKIKVNTLRDWEKEM